MVLAAPGASAAGTEVSRVPPDVVREERVITVNGVGETWQLVWEGKPLPVCGPDEIDMAITCPCAGLAYGEHGRLALVRRRDGQEVERMDLRPLFGQFDGPGLDGYPDDGATLQRWPANFMSDVDRDGRNDPTLDNEIRHRRLAEIMKFADYDRDGHATEFLLQVGTLPCGKRQMALIGVSTSNPHLHVFSAADNSKQPLVMAFWVWAALLKGNGKADSLEWQCGDHGSDVESHIHVEARDGSFSVKRWDRTCSPQEVGGASYDSTPDQ